MLSSHRAAPETTPLWTRRLFLINLSLSLMTRRSRSRSGQSRHGFPHELERAVRAQTPSVFVVFMGSGGALCVTLVRTLSLLLVSLVQPAVAFSSAAYRCAPAPAAHRAGAVWPPRTTSSLRMSAAHATIRAGAPFSSWHSAALHLLSRELRRGFSACRAEGGRGGPALDDRGAGRL